MSVSIATIASPHQESAGLLRIIVSRTSLTERAFISTSANQGYPNSGDYTNLTLSEVFFAPNSNFGSVDITVTEDSIPEPDERFQVILYDEFFAPVGSGVFTVVDNDLTISPATQSVTEPGTVSFTVTRSSGAGALTLYYSTYSVGTANVNDYTEVTLAPLNFANGTPWAFGFVSLLDDNVSEGSETFGIAVMDSSGRVLEEATFTILNTPAYSYQGQTVVLESAGTQFFSVTRDSGSGSGPLWYRVVSAGSADGTDFTSMSPVHMTFSGSVALGSFTVLDDAFFESAQETFALEFSKTGDFTQPLIRQLITIQDNDPLTYAITPVGGATVAEEVGAVTLRITRTTVEDYKILILNTATDATPNDSDFIGISGRAVEFLHGQSSVDVPLTILNDDFPESSETFRLTLTDPQTGTVVAERTVTIQDTDVDPTATTATVGRLADGETRLGVLEAAGDADWYRIEMEAGMTYTIRLDGYVRGQGKVTDPLLSLHDSIGTQIVFDDDGGAGANSMLTYLATQSGTYYIAARSFNDRGAGFFQVSVNPTIAGDDFPDSTSLTPARSITVGVPKTGNIENVGDADWFPIAMTQGTIYNIRLDGKDTQGGTLADPRVYLYSSSGVLIDDNDDGSATGLGTSSLLQYQAPATGTYFIGARAFGDRATGTYAVNVTTGASGSQAVNPDDDFGNSHDSASPQPGTVPATGAATPGSIEVGGDVDFFRVTLAANTEYTISVNGASGSAGTLADPKLYFYDSAGNELDSNDDGVGLNARIFFTGAAGDYYVAARSASDGATGTYQVVVSGPTAGSGASDDWGSSIQSGVTPAVGALTVNGTATGTLERRGDADWFEVNLQAGTAYAITLNGSGPSASSLPDPHVYVRDSNGGVVADKDDGTTGANSLLRWTPAASGTYYIEARAFNDTGTGSYTVGITGSTGSQGASDDFGNAYNSVSLIPGTVLSNGTATAGSIEAGGDVDFFRVTLLGNTEYTISVSGASSAAGTLADPKLYFYDSAGNELAFNDDAVGLNARIFFTGEAGDYYVAARSASQTAMGSYQVVVSGATAGSGGSDDWGSSTQSNITPAVGAVAVNGTANGTLERRGDADWFSVSLEAGTQYAITLNSAGPAASALPDPFVYVRNAAGEVVASRDDGTVGANSLLRWTPTSSGTYYIEARSFNDTGTGAYQVGVSATGTGGASASGDDFAASTSTIGVVAVGSTVDGKLEASGDADWFRITLTGGETYTIGLNRLGTHSTALRDPHLYVLDEDGLPVVDIDDGGTGVNSLLRFVASGNGDVIYFISARADGDRGIGSYQVNLVAGGEGTPGAGDDFSADKFTSGELTLDTPLSGSLQTPGDADWFAVEMVAGTPYSIYLTGTGSSALADPYVYLYGADQTLIASRDDGGAGVNSLLRYTPAESGTYYIGARAFNDLGTGSYEVEVAADVAPLAAPGAMLWNGWEIA